MKSVIAIVCLVAVAMAMPSRPERYEDKFAERMAKHASKPRAHQAGFNPYFAGKSMSEIKHMMGTKMDRKVQAKDIFAEISVGANPATFDARTQWPKCTNIGHIRDQANCGSCWAVAAGEVATDRICIGSNGAKTPMISAEYIITQCTTRSGCNGDEGCNGGYPLDAMNFWKENGICTGGDYGSNIGCQPYAIKPCPAQGCSSDANTPKKSSACRKGYTPTTAAADLHKATSAYSVPSSPASIQTEIFTNGPVEAAFTVYEDFMDYTSGVYIYDGESEELGGHAVKIIGWGTENNVAYWLVANSWNTTWGEQGWFKIRRGTDECGIEDGIVAGKATQ